MAPHEVGKLHWLSTVLVWLAAGACGEPAVGPVDPEPRDTARVVASIVIRPIQLYVDSLGVARQAIASAYDADGRFLYNSTDNPELFTWSSSAPAVLSVDHSGSVSSEDWGAATVTATHVDSVAGTMRVTVQDAVDLSWSTPAGGGLMLSSVAIGPDGTIYAATGESASGLSTWLALSPGGGVLWTLTLPFTGFSTPAIGADGTLYLGARFDSDTVGQVTAVGPDGLIKWVQDEVDGILSSPALGPDGTIYAAGGSSLYAVDPGGEIQWAHEMDKGVSAHSSPAVGSDGTIYVGGDDDLLHAINPDGSPRWTFATGDLILSSPAIGTDGTVYFGSEDGRLYAVLPDGTERWSLQLGPGGVTSSPSIGPDGTVYIMAGELLAIDPAGSIRWKYPAGWQNGPTLVVAGDGTIYFGSFRGITALNADGWIKWHYSTSDHTLGSPAIGVDGMVIAASYSLDMSSESGEGTIRAFVENGSTNGGYSGAAWPTARGGRSNSGRVRW